MNLRPRCRPWLPLTTQQMRLRNLIRIQGVNIEHSAEKALIYYTLHHTKEGAAFYTSEALHLQQKWAEITCPVLLKSNANCVCVKVWACLEDGEDDTCLPQQRHQGESEEQPQQTENATRQVPIRALSEDYSQNGLSPSSLPRPPDKMLFAWGVYFSGLILLSEQPDAKCRANSLIFQINGDYFGSPEHFTTDSLREQLSLNYQRYSASMPKASIPPPDAFSINSPQVSRSSSPMSAEWQLDLLRMSKARYTQLNCPRTEVRKGYDLNKLLRIQELQRSTLQKIRDSVETVTDIKQMSVRCITKDQVLRKRRTTSNSQQHSHYHSMGRALSILLAEQQEVDPHTLLRAQQLQRELESLRSRQRLLLTESNTYDARIKQLRQQLSALVLSREQQETWLHTERTNLQMEQEELGVRHQQQLTLLQTKRHILLNVEHRMSELCMELREIYPIGRNAQGFHTICKLPFPKMEAYAYDIKSPSQQAASLEHVSPLALSAALGYVAHLVQMMAAILDRPLRNPIIHEGSRSRIIDIVKEIPYSSREFPLYSRSSLLSKPVKYAIYLLNQNIAQLCYDITGIRCDMRATIENLLHIFAVLMEIERSQNEVQLLEAHTHAINRRKLHGKRNSANSHSGSSVAPALENSSVECLSKSHSSVDMNDMNHVPVPLVLSPAAMGATKVLKITDLFQQLPSGQPIVIAANAPQQRICRSVGSYSDCEDDDFKNNKIHNEHCYSNSDSNLTLGQSGR